MGQGAKQSRNSIGWHEMSDTPETQEAVERWRQGKINIFDEMARLERERNEAREALEHMKRERQNFHEAWKKFCNPFLEATK